MQLSRHPIYILSQLPQNIPLIPDPIRITMSLRPITPRRMAILPIAIPIIRPLLNAPRRTRQMQLTNQPTIIPRISQDPRHQLRPIRKPLIPIAVNMYGTRIHPGKKTPPTRRTNRTLTISMRKRHSLPHQPINIRRRNIPIPQRRNRIIALLIRTNPQNIRPLSTQPTYPPSYCPKPYCPRTQVNLYSIPYQSNNTNHPISL